MLIFIILLIVVIIWSVGAHLLFPNKISIKEMLVKAAITTVVGGGILLGIYYGDMYDTAVINGSVVSKSKDTVSCSHSYSCNCYTSCTGTGASRSCTQQCSTCYEHSWDYDWNVVTTVGKMEISRIDRQGVSTPPRWSAVTIGEPASNTESYVNYVLASPASLFTMAQQDNDVRKWAGMLPVYPRVYDYYRYNRVVQVKASYPKAEELNTLLNNDLRTLGAEKQVNIIVVFVGTTLPEYRYALERSWVGAKKNDVVVIMGMDAGTLSWVDTITFGKNAGNEMLTIQLRDNIKTIAAQQQFGNPLVLGSAITSTIKNHFHRKSMEDFKYLKDDYRPSNVAIAGFVIFQILLLMFMTVYFYKEDPLD